MLLRIRLLLFAAFLSGAGLILIPQPLAAQQRGVTVTSLPLLLDQALTAYGENRHADAADLLERAEREFSQDPAFREPDVRRRILLLRGHAETGAGRNQAAAATFSRFLKEFPDDPEAAGVLHALAIALAPDHPEEAAQRLLEFEQRHGHRPEARTVPLHRADLLVRLGRHREAIAIWEDLSVRENQPPLLRGHARLRAVQLALTRHDESDEWTRILLAYRWPVEALPEIATLSLIALRAGDLLLEKGNGEQALLAYRLVPSAETLRQLHRARILELETALQRIPSPGGDPRSAFSQRLLESLVEQTAALEATGDFTSLLLLRRAQAFLLAGRPRESWLLCESLALDDTSEPEIRREAHYRWIVAASELEKWEEALAIARNYVARYPDSPNAPLALSLIAQAHQEQRRHTEAVEVLNDLIAAFPHHPLRPRWVFTRGFNRAVLDQFAAALRDFSNAAEQATGALAQTAALWTGIVPFLERDYETALERFRELLIRFRGKPIEPEILFRKASTLYAMRGHEEAEEAIGRFLEGFPRHSRQGEALVLLGDIRMGKGDLDNAMRTFAAIPPETGHLHLYGLFQRGKILRALQDYEGMVRLFENHLANPDLTAGERVSEALYWTGWAWSRLDEPERALAAFENALERFGDEPAAGEIGSILTALENHRRTSGHEPFDQWLEAERQRALQANRLTYFSRLTLHLSSRMEHLGRPRQAEALLFEILDHVPDEKLDPSALARLGRLLLENQLGDGMPMIRRLLREHPAAPARGSAYLALARWHSARGETVEALRWSRRFLGETPTDPEAGEAMLLHASLLRDNGDFDQAVEQYEEILRLRSLRGKTHAEALLGLAETSEAAGRPDQAIAYYQRIYTLYQAFPRMVAEAYLRSGILFEQRGNPEAAGRTFREMREREELRAFPSYETAMERLARLPPMEEPLP